MNIVILNGSPSGQKGITAHYVKYLEAKFPDHRFRVIEAARKIRQIEGNAALREAIVKEMIEADAILWAFPVYVMLVPAQLKRFIELLFEHVGRSALAGKVTSSLSTSAHHYDHTTHDYMQGVCCDLGMTYLRGFSAGQEELLTEEGRRDLLGFAKELFLHVAGEVPVDAGVPPVQWTPPEYETPLPPAVPKRSDKKIAVISDADAKDHNLLRMIEVFDRSVALPVDRINLRDLRIVGGCLGCMGCSDSGHCGYKDDYAEAFERVLAADVVVYAGAVRDRFLSARMKVFIDRFFSNGHRPVLKNKLMGFLVSGPLSQLAPLREILDAKIEVAHCQRLGIVTDEHPDPDATTSRLQAMARAAERWVEAPWYAPPTFRGYAADKNFRDLVYEHKGIMTADHRYYRATGRYDFPQKKRGKRLFMTVLLLLRSLPFLRRWMKKAMKKGMQSGHTRAYRRVLETL